MNPVSKSRVFPEQGLDLLKNGELVELGQRATEIRFQKNPEPVVTFVIDSNPNYTNVCITDCSFCAFYRKPGHPEAWTLTVDQVLEKIANADKLGCTTVLLQGGHNPSLPLDFYTTVVRETRKQFPHITPHFFTASEIQTMAQVSGLNIRQVLEKLKEAGQSSLPGGGAEVLSQRVRMRVSPKKGGPEKWLEVHETAHQIGMRSTATMMYGHLDQPEDIIEHLEAIRQLQDRTGGFTAFIPWSFKPNHTPLQKKVSARTPAGTYLRMLALSRIYLDNFDHVQASWFSEGKKTGQVALHFGADDFGGTIFEENVHRATDHINKTTVNEIITLILESGFKAAQRDTHYNILKHYKAAARASTMQPATA